MPYTYTYPHTKQLTNAQFRTYSILVDIALESAAAAAKFPSIFEFLMEYALEETKSTNERTNELICTHLDRAVNARP